VRSVCVTSTLLAQCSATVFELHSDFGSLCVQNCTVMFLSCEKTAGQQQGGGIILMHTQMIYGLRRFV